jgi:enamine deaminase RidA (YjgF/YER057c/UK114 family)
MTIEKIQPDKLFKRNVGGHVLYSHVVVASGEKLVFVSGQLARDKDGNIVGPRDMRAQIRQVGENLKNALEAAGATLNELVTIISASACLRAPRSKCAGFPIPISWSKSRPWRFSNNNGASQGIMVLLKA